MNIKKIALLSLFIVPTAVKTNFFPPSSREIRKLKEQFEKIKEEPNISVKLLELKKLLKEVKDLKPIADGFIPVLFLIGTSVTTMLTMNQILSNKNINNSLLTKLGLGYVTYAALTGGLSKIEQVDDRYTDLIHLEWDIIIEIKKCSI